MRGVKPTPDPGNTPDWAFRVLVLIGIVLIWMAHCTPLGKVPEGQSAEERWREHG